MPDAVWLERSRGTVAGKGDLRPSAKGVVQEKDCATSTTICSAVGREGRVVGGRSMHKLKVAPGRPGNGSTIDGETCALRGGRIEEQNATTGGVISMATVGDEPGIGSGRSVEERSAAAE